MLLRFFVTVYCYYFWDFMILKTIRFFLILLLSVIQLDQRRTQFRIEGRGRTDEKGKKKIKSFEKIVIVKESKSQRFQIDGRFFIELPKNRDQFC